MRLFRLAPAAKDYLWGGHKLKEEWHKNADFSNIAETWELSFHPDGRSVVCAEAGGTGAVGRPLDEAAPPETWGTNCKKFPFFPVLVKFIDAADNLSVQVHPSDAYALAEEGQFGKTEMWYVADCEPGAGIWCGFKRKVSPEEYAAGIADGSILALLNFFEARPGESYFIPAGTVHAIGRGMTVCEVQQNSNLTYRVYDFGRVGRDGRPRELHVEKAKQVTDLSPYVPAPAEAPEEGLRKIASCPYFSTWEVRSGESWACETDQRSFSSVTVIEGEGEISVRGEGCVGKLPFRKGDTFFAPAQTGSLRVTGRATFLLTQVE